MRAAVDVQELAKPGARRPSTPMPASGPMFLYQPRGLERVFQEAVRHRRAVLASRNLMKVPDVEPSILLAIQAQQPLDFRRGDPAHRRGVAPLVDQPDVAVGFISLPP